MKKIYSLSNMFKNCYSLNSIAFSNNFETSQIMTMISTFENCRNLTSLDLSIFNTKEVTNMAFMFSGCISLENLKFNFTTEKVRNMESIFENCPKIKKLDLSKWNTTSTSDMSNMFNGCSSLEDLKIKFDTSKVTEMQKMFANWTLLTSLDITSFNASLCKNFDKMFENDTDLDLYYDSSIFPNMNNIIPDYVNLHDVHEN